MKCDKLLKEALDNMQEWVKPLAGVKLDADLIRASNEFNMIPKELAEKHNIPVYDKVLSDWIMDSKPIVREYLETGKHKDLDKYFKNTKPTYVGNVSRIGMLSKNMLNHLKVGDVTTNTFPFATSVDDIENDIFIPLVNERLKSSKHKNKVKVRYIIDATDVPQYDLRDVNTAETEVLIKPNSAFKVEKVDGNNVYLKIIKSSKKAGKPLLSAAALAPLANKDEEL